MRIVKILGIPEILRNIDRARKRWERGIARGLKKAGLMIQRESQFIVPIDTATLKNSARTRNVGGTGFETDIIVSYRTEYAVYVHEDMNARHKPGKLPKYLEKPAREKRKEAIQIILAEARRG